LKRGTAIKDKIKSWKKEALTEKAIKDSVSPEIVLKKMSEIVEDDAILTVDVGQNQIWCARHYNIKKDRSFLTSGGLGTMGYSLPSAVGAKIAAPKRRVIAAMGDGGFQMSMFELGTIAEYDINIIILLFNNSGLGMVREIQNNIYGRGKNSGVQINKNPDFVKIAQAYGLKGRRVASNEDFEDALKEAMNSDSAFLLECIVDENESTL
jgi:acetolactate synthase-1/2/3 large subunit